MDKTTAWGSKPGYRAAKRTADIACSGLAIVCLSPVLVGCAIAVKATSPGPALFRQSRSGLHLNEFEMLKFRTMRVDTPQLPSHMINANDWLTPIGGLLRKTSLDELPQLLNIFRGDMSIIGPRPALPSQVDLLEERDKYGANDVPVGLSGWAQVNGRDELPIAVKAKLDGDYAQSASFWFDAKIIAMTVVKAFKHEGVVESKVPEPEGETK